MGNEFNPESERAIRGMNWERVFKDSISPTIDAIHVRSYFESKGHTNYYELCRLEHKFGDYFVKDSGNVIHFECVTVRPQNNGWFPERKVITYGNHEFPNCTKFHDYWFAFFITDDGKTGEQIFVHKNVWQSYARKLPKKLHEGKLFRIFTSWNLKNLRSKTSSIMDILHE